MQFSLHIGDEQYAIKDRWTITEWMNILKWSPEIEENWPRLISHALGCSLEDAMAIPDDTMYVIMGIMINQINPQDTEFKPIINGHELINFDKITFGQFVDLEVMLSREPRKTMDTIVSILYSGADTTGWYIDDVWPAFEYYLSWRKEIFRQYKSLFEIDDVEEGTVSGSKDQIHAWYDMIMVLADEKFLNIELVVERPMIEAFNFLAWKKDEAIKQQIELNKRKKNKIL